MGSVLPQVSGLRLVQMQLSPPVTIHSDSLIGLLVAGHEVSRHVHLQLLNALEKTYSLLVSGRQ
jgi:hypothetical protein